MSNKLPLKKDFKDIMESVEKMNSNDFSNTLETEKQKMLDLKKQYPNNPLFSQLNTDDFNISQKEFMDMCKIIMNGNMSDTLLNAFNFMNNTEENTEGSSEDKNKRDGVPDSNTTEG